MQRTRMLRISGVLAAVLALVAVAPAQAITHGEPDGNGHPYVGTLLFQRSDGFFSCTGTLVSSTVMLTAGHCTEDGGVINLGTWVTFVPEVDLDAIIDRDRTLYPTIADFLDDPANGWIVGAAHPHPDWDGISFPNTHDVGVVVLATAKPMSQYGQLPTLGQFDDLNTAKGALRDRRFTVVGYGVQSLHPVFGQDDYSRYVAETSLTNTKSAYTRGFNFQFTNSPGVGTGGGGTCFGDSGGPVFLGDTRVIAAITSFGITPKCTGVDFAYRADISDTLDFVDDYLP